MRSQGGFAYLFLLFLIALLAISAAAVGTLGYYERQRSDEAELLRIGHEFRAALSSYYNTAERREFPATLDQLLEDGRTRPATHHLRKIYFDPMTRERDWVLVLEAGRIVGIHSLSERQPMKVSGFAATDAEFENAEHYSAWIFRAVPSPAGQLIERG